MTPQEQFPVGSKVRISPNKPEEIDSWKRGGYQQLIGAKGVISSWVGEIAYTVVGPITWPIHQDYLHPIESVTLSNEYDPMKQLEVAKKRRDDNLRSVFGY